MRSGHAPVDLSGVDSFSMVADCYRARGGHAQGHGARH